MTHTHYRPHLGTWLRRGSPVLRTGSSAPGKVSCPTPTVRNSHRLPEACLRKDIGCNPAEAWGAMFKAHASQKSSQKELYKKCPCTTTAKTLRLRFSFTLLRVLRASARAKRKGGNWKRAAEEGGDEKARNRYPQSLQSPATGLVSPLPHASFFMGSPPRRNELLLQQPCCPL